MIAVPRWFEPAPVRLGLGATVTAVYAACVAGAPAPVEVRVLAALLALLAWPGAMLVRFFLVDREIEWPGRIAYSFALGLVLACGLVLVAHFGRFDAAVGLWALPLLGFALALVRPRHDLQAPDPRGLLPWLLLAGWVLIVGAVVGSLGAPLMTDTDSPDHIGTIRRMMVTREAFPTDAFFRDAGPTGADPRKGLYHPVVALVARAAHADAVTTWRVLPLFLIPLFVCAIYVLTLALTRSRMTGLVAAVLFPFLYGGGLGGTELRETVYSTRVGEIVALLAVAALVRYVNSGGRRRLGLFWIVATCAIFVHVWYALYFALALSVYAVFALVAEPSRARFVRFAAGFGGLLVLAGPYLAFRAGQAYGPRNVIHTEPQGLLYLSEKLYFVDPQGIWTWNGIWLPIALVAVPWFWSRRKEGTGWIYLATVAPCVLAIVLNPFVLPLAESKLGYLTMRLVWIIPVIPAVAAIATSLARTVVRGRGARRAIAGAGLGACVLLLLPPIGQGMSLLTERNRLHAEEAKRSADPWADVLAFLRDRYPGPRVLASDPVTSYMIPAYSGHQVMTFFDQHSSPNDPRALDRILDARKALSPYVDARHTLEILRAYGVDAVVLNQRFDGPVSSDYWAMTPALYAVTLAKFRDRPQLFRPVFEAPGAWVFELTDAAKTGALPDSEDVARPYVPMPAPPAGSLPPGSLSDGLLLQHGTEFEHRAYAPGDTVRFVTHWSLIPGRPHPEPGGYTVFVRLESQVPRGPLYADSYDKLYRKVLEKWTGRKWRLRTSHRPISGVYAPDQWRADEIVADAYEFPIPESAVPGAYTVRVRMVRIPHYPNTRVRDYLRDEDAFSGPVVGQLVITPKQAVSPATNGAAR